MANAPKKNFSPLPVGKYGNSTSGSPNDIVMWMMAKAAWRQKESKRMGHCAACDPQRSLGPRNYDTHFFCNEENETWIDDSVERGTAGARMRVEDAEEAVQQKQEDMKNVENVGLTNREPEKTFQEVMVAIGKSLSDLASSDDGEDGEDEDDETTEQGKLSKDDETGWAMGTITKTVQQHMERLRQKQMKLDILT